MSSLQSILKKLSARHNERSSSTVHYAFPFMFLLATALSATALLSENDTYLVVEPREHTISAGENFAVDVYVVARVPVNAVDIRLALPKGQVRVLGIDTGESVITLWTKEPYAEKNVVYIQGGTYRKGFIGKHLIATVNAQALSSGLAQIGVTHAELYAGDGTGDKVKVVPSEEDSTELLIAREDGTYLPSATAGGDVTFTIIGDVDGDGLVTLKDISTFMSAWHSRSATYDFNGDTRMTFRDFGIILAKYFLQ